ncbi:transposase [Streptosporangium sp. NPDC023825]|uniref:transposase n=1 Tax=Streptosporangium sp. NPDC023825 TaxID=3154909 RepID=UPI00342EE065
MTTFSCRLVPDELWELFQQVVPRRDTAPGRRPAASGWPPDSGGDRVRGTTGCTWRQLPPVLGASWQTVHRRFTEWSGARVWAKLYRICWTSSARAVCERLGQRAPRERADLRGPNPVDQGKKGAKIHIITDRTGPTNAGPITSLPSSLLAAALICYRRLAE